MRMEFERAREESLHESLDKELEALSKFGSTREDRFCIHKAYFELLITNKSIFKDLLTDIKSEYEDCIETILRGKKELLFLSRKLSEQVGAPSTLRIYKIRRKELEEKIVLLQQNNSRILEKIEYLRYQKEQIVDDAQDEESPENLSSRSVPLIDGLSIEEQTHIPTLRKTLALTMQKKSKFQENNQKKYVPKQLKQTLMDKYFQIEEVRYNLEKVTKSLELKLCGLNVSFSRVLDQMSGEKTDALNKIATALRLSKDDFDKPTMNESDEENISSAESDLGESSQNTTVLNPANDTEGLAIQCKATFQELLETDNIEEAVLFAAHSPSGVLRTKETIEILNELDSSVLQTYWEALLSTLLIQNEKLSSWESIKYVKYSLRNDEKQQLTHWMAQNVIEVTEEIADLISKDCQCVISCSCGFVGLAQTVYTKIGKHKKAMVCLLQQGRYLGALEYASVQGHFDRKDLIDAFGRCPSLVVATKLCRREKPFQTLFSIEEIISILMASQDNQRLTSELIKRAADEGYQIKSSEIDKPGVDDNSRVTNQKWLDLCQLCWSLEQQSLAEELFAYVIVKMAMATAKKIYVIERYSL